MITKNIIGHELSALSDRTITSFSAAYQAHLPEAFAVATAEEVDQAVEKAHRAWRRYRATSGQVRAKFLRLVADGIEGLGEILLDRVHAETAYPVARIITERTRTCQQLRMFASVAESDAWREITEDEALPDRTPVPRPWLRREMHPIGPVVVFGASNFPLAYSTAGGDAASALAVGCPVIVKAHDAHLGTNALVAEVIRKAALALDLPDGVFSSLQGDGFETGRRLVQHPLTAAVGFTGSLAGGRALFDLGQQRKKPIPVFAEMGSVNPVFIFPQSINADRHGLASRLAASMTLTVGQFCTNPGIIVVLHDEDGDAWMESLRLEIEKVEAQTMLTPGIASAFRRGMERVDQTGRITWITRREAEAHAAAPVLASCDVDVFLSHPELHHEIFGPYSLIVRCRHLDDFLRVAEAMEGQLTASVMTGPVGKEEAWPLVELLTEKAGRIIFNGVPTGVEVCASMTHGGPYPASTDSRFTAVGHFAVRRWLRPVTYQGSMPGWEGR